MKIFRKIFLIYMISIIFVGCADKIEAEDRGYVITVAVDKGVDKKYEFSFIIAQFSEYGDTKSSGKAITVSADNILEAINKADSSTNKLLYLGQLKTIIFSENVLQNGYDLNDLLNQFESNKDISSKTVILSVKTNARDMANLICESDLSSGIYIYDFYKNSAEQTSFTEKVELESIIIDMHKNKSAIIPIIQSYDDKNNLKISGGVIVSNDGIRGFANEFDIMNNIWLHNRAEGTIIVDDEGNTLEVLDNYCKYKFYDNDNYILCEIDIKARGSINGDYKQNDIYSMEKNFENIISNNILNYITKIKTDYNIDLLGFSSRLKKHNKDMYNKYENEKSFLKFMKFDVNCDIDIKSTGIS